jgi:membrane-associated HD superfamily phosphohydrolase
MNMTIGAQVLNIILGAFSSVVSGLISSIFSLFVNPVLEAIATALGLSA